jgi:hypothetical protein
VCILYCGCFNLFVNVWVSVRVCVCCVMCGCLVICVLVFAVFCVVCIVFCIVSFTYVHLFLFVVSVLLYELLPTSENTIAVSN